MRLGIWNMGDMGQVWDREGIRYGITLGRAIR